MIVKDNPHVAAIAADQVNPPHPEPGPTARLDALEARATRLERAVLDLTTAVVNLQGPINVPAPPLTPPDMVRDGIFRPDAMGMVRLADLDAVNQRLVGKNVVLGPLVCCRRALKVWPELYSAEQVADITWRTNPANVQLHFGNYQHPTETGTIIPGILVIAQEDRESERSFFEVLFHRHDQDAAGGTHFSPGDGG